MNSRAGFGEKKREWQELIAFSLWPCKNFIVTSHARTYTHTHLHTKYLYKENLVCVCVCACVGYPICRRTMFCIKATFIYVGNVYSLYTYARMHVINLCVSIYRVFASACECVLISIYAWCDPTYEFIHLYVCRSDLVKHAHTHTHTLWLAEGGDQPLPKVILDKESRGQFSMTQSADTHPPLKPLTNTHTLTYTPLHISHAILSHIHCWCTVWRGIISKFNYESDWKIATCCLKDTH